MKLEQQMYKISRVGKERIYTIGDLENLSATALYYGEGGGSSGFSGGIGGGGFGGIGKKECNKYGIVITPLMESSEGVGNSNYFTWLADPQPTPDLVIKTPSSWMMTNREGAVPTSFNSMRYFNSKGQELGGTENLNYEEFRILFKKHFK